MSADGSPRPDARAEGLTADFLAALGVPAVPARTTPFDPGYDPLTVEAHIEQSAPLMEHLKLSMASWIVAREESTRRKVAAARSAGVRTVTGGGPFEIAATLGKLERYLDLCGEMGFDRIEAGEGFTELRAAPSDVVRMASDRGLEVQFELGRKHEGAFDTGSVDQLLEQGRQWLSAGAAQLVIEARESAQGVGLFDDRGRFQPALAERIADAFGLEVVVFEAPNKPSQFALLDHFGPDVRLSNVRLEELLRVEIYRRGLHSDAFLRPNLRPRNSSSDRATA